MPKCANYEKCGNIVPEDMSRTEHKELCAYCYLSTIEGKRLIADVPEPHFGKPKKRKIRLKPRPQDAF